MGRVAARMMRAAAVTCETGVGLQCYVDDLILAVRGTKKHRERQAAIILLLWSELGLKLPWHKARRGTSIDWIGANFTYIKVDNVITGVSVTITEDKVDKLTEKAL